jgi:Carboxypeptidase regulatory-like domain
MKSQSPLYLLLALVCFFAPAFIVAQDTAQLTGTVTDPSGAAVANAQVIITNEGQGTTRTAASNNTGGYLFSALPVGKYDMVVTAPGFKKYQAKGIFLNVGQKARNDVNLAVGTAQETINVEGANVAQVETQSSELGGVVAGKEISQLQLNGRNFTQLITLVPGVTNQTGQDEGQVGVLGSVAFSVNGGRTEYNNWEMDGGDTMDNGSNGTINVYPSIDAIGEFKVLTSNYGAEYGKNGSGTIEVETKSGTSTFHGDAYEFIRNDAFNATPYFLSSVPPYKKNDFGYTIGGPVYIPHVYNTNKQKTFFFWSQEWRRDRIPANFNQLVPSAAERTGNFSDLCPNLNSGTANDFSDCPKVNGTYTPNLNVLPGFNASNPNVQALLALIPLPTQGVPGAESYLTSITQPTTWREELVRIDHNVTDKNRLTFRYIHDSWDTINPVPLWTNATSFPTVQTNFDGPGVSAVARLTSTLSPTLLNEFVASYTTDHIILHNVGAWQRSPNTSFGGLFPTNGFGVVPGINLVDQGTAYGGGFGEDPGYIPNGTYNSNPTYSLRDNITKIVGKHNLQFGAYFQFAQKNEIGGELAAGSYPGYLTFNPAVAGVATTGNSFADLLLGEIASFGQQNTQIKYYNRYRIYEPYFQDDWRVTSRLTLNLGLRMSLFGLYYEKYHQAFNFDPRFYKPGVTSVDPNTDIVSNLTANGGQSVTNLPNGIVQCGVTAGVPAGCMQDHFVNPAPRVGFAFDPLGNGKWAIRAGYGIFYEHGNGNETGTESLENSPPLAFAAQQLNIPGVVEGVTPYQDIGSSAGAASPQFPLNVVSLPNQMQFPYTQQWHLDVQHDIARGTVVSVAYVGNSGTHLNRELDMNQLFPVVNNPYKPGETFTGNECSQNPDQFGVPQSATTPSGVLIPYRVNPVTGLPTGPAVNVAVAQGCVVAGADPFRPFAGYTTISAIQNAASSNYNALQVAVRRSIGGLQLNFAYTYSHSIDDASDRYDTALVNTYDPSAFRASSSFDQRQVLNFGYVWDLPFFKGKGLRQDVLGGWQYTGITSFATGSPFSVIYNADNAGVGNGINTVAYADVVGNPRAGVTQSFVSGFGPLFYNPSAYATPTALTFGNSGRNSQRNPDYLNFDMALLKHFAINERYGFDFRAEAFNIFNHTEWLPIAGDAGSAANVNGAFTNVLNTTSIFRPNGAHDPRILQFALKFLF